MRLFLQTEEGFITEAPTSNVFIVNQDDCLLTAPEDEVLYGITRLSILEIAEDENIETKVERIPIDALENAKEIFLTSSSHIVCPVVMLRQKAIREMEA